MTSCRLSRWRIAAMLDLRGPLMVSLKRQSTIYYRWSIQIVAIHCLYFSEKNAFFLHFGDRQIEDDRQTDRQSHRWTAALHKGTFAVTSDGLLSHSSWQRQRLSATVLSVCFLSLCRQNAKKNAIFSKTAISSYGVYWQPSRTWALQRTRYSIPTIEDGCTSPSGSIDMT